MSKTVSKFTLAASVLLAMVFTLSCSLDDIKDYVNDSSSSSGGEAGNSFSYCLINGQCLSGPFTSKECGDLGGLPNNSCNGSGGNPSSSSNGGGGGNPGGGSSSSGGGQGGGGGGSSCPVSAVSNNSVTCGGQTYKTVQIGTQKWFAENLNYNASGSRCYDDLEANCNTYGRLYNWSTAMGVCPSGWHLPSDDEWQTLIDFAGGNDAGTKLKATSGWNDDYRGQSGNGTDEYGFLALPGGRGGPDSFGFVRDAGYWWSATEYGSGNAHRFLIYMSYRDVPMSWEGKGTLYSVRCVQD